MSDKPHSKPVNRSDTSYAKAFLLGNTKLCVVLAVVFALLGVALAGDWAGHSAANPNWQVKNWIGAAIAWTAALVMVLFAIRGSKK